MIGLAAIRDAVPGSTMGVEVCALPVAGLLAVGIQKVVAGEDSGLWKGVDRSPRVRGQDEQDKRTEKEPEESEPEWVTGLHADKCHLISIEVPGHELRSCRRSAERSVEKFHEMNDPVAISSPPCSCLNLQNAPGIRRDDYVGLGLADVRRFPVPELRGHFPLHQIEDSCASAADLAFGNRYDGDARDRLEHAPRLSADALRVREMAGVVIRHPQRRRT